MAKVRIKNMMFYGFHGVYEYEREQGQKFFIDIEVETNDANIAEDEPNEAVSPAAVYGIVRDVVENKRFRQLETLGYNVNADILKAISAATGSTIVIRKPSVPIAGPLDCIEVEVCTTRKDIK